MCIDLILGSVAVCDVHRRPVILIYCCRNELLIEPCNICLKYVSIDVFHHVMCSTIYIDRSLPPPRLLLAQAYTAHCPECALRTKSPAESVP